MISIDHCTIRTRRLPASIAFYEQVLQLRQGPRPAFGFPGAWLYSGENALVHLVTESAAAPDGNGAPLDHVAFAVAGLAACRTRLQGLGIDFEERVVPGNGLTQIFLSDPDGLRLELCFRETERPASP